MTQADYNAIRKLKLLESFGLKKLEKGSEKIMGEIVFSEQITGKGYDKVQVDEYIRRLTEEYEKAYDAYETLCGKYDALMRDHQNLARDYKQLEAEKQAGVGGAGGVDAIIMTRTVMDAERLAQEIINKAYNEEMRIIEQTQRRLEHAYKIIGQMMSEAQKRLPHRAYKELGEKLNEIEAVT